MATTAKLTPAQQEEKINSFFTNAPAFAQPICEKLREVISTADPELQPSWKWGTPVYEKKGHSMVCAISVHKQHVNLTLFQGAQVPDTYALYTTGLDGKNMRTIKFTDASQIQEKYLVEYIKAAAQLKPDKAVTSTERSEIEIPEDLKQALADAQQLEKFEKMAYTHRKEYVRWVTEAKRPETRNTRITKTVERITDGKKFS
ncbi:hypothetical protein TH61_00950 [Rufibacter sp. DG15C]|uniref:DUF1801 domain-containing protein n=1 Tax=Rufibacter sp. DG15C TaxID=1379909 RepID=UPI00078CBEA9|nr:DUF1801 domain-containing protein [Rufibacter sp. DG15C]AMM50033.1 hypothetical protein TH61_00950 [Rufibacter sp. DG15C]